MSRVLVTGASGFIGGHLVRQLCARGNEVRCLVRASSKVSHLRDLDIEYVSGDLSTSTDWNSALKNVRSVFHLAGKTAALRAGELAEINGRGAGIVAAACARQESPPVMILVSSLAAAGTSPDDRPRCESDPPQPVSHYGRSKLAGEKEAERFAADVPLTIVRPGMVFGPRDREMLPIFRSVIGLGIHAVPGFRDHGVALIHVDDLCELLIRAADRGQRVAASHITDNGKGKYFASDAQQPTYADLGRLIAKAAGRSRVRLFHLPVFCARALAGMSQAISFLRRRPSNFNLDKIREGTAGAWLASTEAATKELGFTPEDNLHERLKQTITWYREARWIWR